MKRESKVFIVSAVLLLVVFFSKILLADTGKPSPKLSNLSQTTIGDPQFKKAEVIQRTKKLQMPFIANEGQTDERVMFYANTFGGTVFVTKDGEIVYSLPHRKNAGADAHAHNRPVNPPGSHNKGEKGRVTPPFAKGNAGGFDDVHHSSPAPDSSGQADPQHNKRQNTSDAKQEKGARGVVLKEEIIGGRIDKIKGLKKAITTVNDLRGNDPAKHKTNIPTYEVVTLGEVYEGIELKLKAYGNNIEKLFYVKPNADPGQIKLKLSGAKSIRVNEEGQLEAETALGIVTFTRPLAYQEIQGKRVEVAGEYTTPVTNPPAFSFNKQSHEGPGSELTYGFHVKDYDRTKELVIDPLLASTYLGGSPGSDYAYSMAIDHDGNIYVTGHSNSPEFPTTSGAYDTFPPGGGIFISKLNEDLTRLLASTYLGAGAGYSIAIDTDGDIYVTGRTTSDFPTTQNAYDTSFNGGKDAFVSKLNGDLTKLLASTFLGGVDDDYGYSITIDSTGNVFVSGETQLSDFPTTHDAYDTSFNDNYSYDVFVSKLNSDLTNLLGSTCLGGSHYDYVSSLTIDSDGNIFVAGYTWSADFPTTPGAYDTTYNKSSGAPDGDAFVSRLNSNLTGLLASTYLGGSRTEYCYSAAIDLNGNIYIAGYTGSSDFPTTPGAYETSGNYGGFVSKLSGDLTNLLASTYLNESSGNTIAIASEGVIFVAGSGIYVVKLSEDLTNLLASKRIGESRNNCKSMAIDSGGNIYVTGSAWSAGFPTTNGAYDTFNSYGDYDAFISKLDSDLTNLLASTYLGEGGGSGQDSGESIATDKNGNVYITGYTQSSDFPTTTGVYDISFDNTGNYDVFVSKLSSDLTSLLVSTYLGGTGWEWSHSISIDLGGNIYIAGSTGSSDFPTTPGAYETSGNYGGFVSKLSGDLTNLLASTYLSYLFGTSIVIDSDENIFISGTTYSTSTYDFSDVFTLKLNGDLTDMLASIYFGGSAWDYIDWNSDRSIAIDSEGNIYVTGYTYSSDFPTTTDAYDTSFNGYFIDIYYTASDAFVTKLSGDLKEVLASTFLGGSAFSIEDELYGNKGNSIAIDSTGNVYINGSTSSTDFPTTPGGYETSGGNGFVSKLSANLTSLLASTYFTASGSIAIDSNDNIYVAGGSSLSKLNNDLASLLRSASLSEGSISSIHIDSDKNIYVTGYTDSSDFPITAGAYDTSYNYSGDAFVSKFDSNLSANPVAVPYVGTNLSVDGNLDESGWDIATDVSNVVIGTTNNTAKFGVLWDSTYLYVGMKVLDDTLYNDSTYVHEDDSVEIYIDGDHNHSTTYDSYDRQFIKGWNDSTLFEQHGKKTGVLHGWASISGGYSIELAIPWSNLGVTPTAGMTIGFSVGYNDDDDGSGRDGQAVWIGTENNYKDTSALGDIVLEANPDLITVPYISTNLTVDGNVSESAWDITTAVSKVVIGTTNNTTTFGVLWDNTYLYVGMTVLDDTLYNDSTSVWQDDGV